MGKKLYVGNLTEGKLYVGHLPEGFTKRDLEKLFKPFGTVVSAQVRTDPDTGRPKGFGFVEMGSEHEAQAAIAALSGQEMDGRRLKAAEPKPKPGGRRRS
jgi:RNA recognition motif-containing protein